MFDPEHDVLIHSTNAHVISLNAIVAWCHHTAGTVQTRCLRSVAASLSSSPALTYSPSLSLHMSNFLFSLSVTPSPQAITAKVAMSTCFSGGVQLHGRPAKYDRLAVSSVQSEKQFLHTLACFLYPLHSQSCLQTCKMMTNQQMKVTNENVHVTRRTCLV